jgi:hypothetical protein
MARAIQLEEALKPLDKYFYVENPLFDTIEDIFTTYTDTVSELVGDCNQWLDWYRFETDMGRRSKEVSIAGKTLRIKSIDSLANMIIKTKENDTSTN